MIVTIIWMMLHVLRIPTHQRPKSPRFLDDPGGLVS